MSLRCLQVFGTTAEVIQSSSYDNEVPVTLSKHQQSCFQIKVSGRLSFSSLDQVRRDALLRTVAEATTDWLEAQQKVATVTVDILWQPSTYERLLNAWNFNSEESLAILNWLIDLVKNAIEKGQKLKC